jgi:hypothetical protein
MSEQRNENTEPTSENLDNVVELEVKTKKMTVLMDRVRNARPVVYAVGGAVLGAIFATVVTKTLGSSDEAVTEVSVEDDEA